MKISAAALSRMASIAADTGVARGSANNGDPSRRAAQHLIHETPEELQGIILEGQGRPVEQL